ncbi:amidohydrolase family protein [Amycolatopsis jejuensis]|uniref:amidohydrolase family protein n=1 Tax=Amycolatopsis jejuensis TaxID=330084 RepID=UPI0005254665|nr:amidohydrolase family protein [Amycolatopsis jejuensis]
MTADLLFDGGYVVTMDPERRMIRDGAVAVTDGAIVAVGKSADLRGQYPAARRVDCTDRLVIPGLIDAHNHPVHFLSQGFSDDVPVRWRIANRIRPLEQAISAADTQAAAMGNFAAMLLNGTTCFADPGSTHPEAVCAAAEEIGIRGVVARSSQDRSTASMPTASARLESTEEVLAASAAFHDAWDGRADGRISAGFSLRDMETTSDELRIGMCAAAQRCGGSVQMHLILGNEPQRPPSDIERLDRLGILGPHLALVHMGAVTEAEAELLAATGTRVVHCPSASMVGAMGVVGSGGFPKMFDAGVVVGLGTDAAAVSRFLDLIRVMYLAAAAHKDVTADPLAAGSYRALEMATIDGARVLRIDDRVGSLEVGKRADLVTLDLTGPAWQPDPYFNPVANLVYAADSSSVRTVVVDGRVLVEDRVATGFDPAELWQASRRARETVMTRSGIDLKPKWPVF